MRQDSKNTISNTYNEIRGLNQNDSLFQDDVEEIMSELNSSQKADLLMMAVSHARDDDSNNNIVQAVIAGGADPNIVNSNGVSPIMVAANNNAGKIIGSLAAGGADLTLRTKNNSQTRGEFSAMDYAAGKSNATQALQSVVNEANYVTSDGHTLLSQAARNSNITEMNSLFRRGADVNKPSPETGSSPLHYAARNLANAAMDLLLEKGANIEAKNKDGNTALHEATKSPYPEAMKKLIENDANVNTQNKQGRTPLHDAVESKNIEKVEMLINAGASLETKAQITLTVFDRKGRPKDKKESLSPQELADKLLQRAGNEDNKLKEITELLNNSRQEQNSTEKEGKENKENQPPQTENQRMSVAQKIIAEKQANSNQQAPHKRILAERKNQQGENSSHVARINSSSNNAVTQR